MLPIGVDSIHPMLYTLCCIFTLTGFQSVAKEVTDPPYRTDLINAAMGARRLTNRAVAEKAGVGVMTVSKIRNGNPRVSYMTLKRVVEALGLTIAEVSGQRGT